MLETKHLSLINCNKAVLEAVITGDEAIRELLGVNVPEKWTEFGAPIFEYSLKVINNLPEEAIWWAYLPILKSENMLLGSCGYKGKPDENACVEIGYEIAESYRNQGFATELAQALILNAFSFSLVKKVIAHTLAVENASVKVLKKCGMTFVEETTDPDEGTVWKWEIHKGF